MKSREPSERHQCILFNEDISWSSCFEVQEVRREDMDMNFFATPFDVKKADEACTKCRWCFVNQN